jgi:hypothetical protein
MNNYPYYPNNTGYYVYPIITNYPPNYQPNAAGYKPIQVSGLSNTNVTNKSKNSFTSKSISIATPVNTRPDITDQSKSSFASKSINISTPVNTLSNVDKEYILWLRQQKKEMKDNIKKNNKETTEKLTNPECKPTYIIIRNERNKVMLDRKFKSIRNIFDNETVNKIKSIKKLLKPINDDFIKNAKNKCIYKNHNIRYYNLNIETFINLLEYFEIPYDVQDIIALYENPGNQPDNDILQNELFGISTIIQLCVKIDTKYKRRNIMFIQICNCDVTVIPSLSGFYGELDDTILIPLYMGKIPKYSNHLQKVGIDKDLYLEDEGMYNDAYDVFEIFLNIVNSLTEEKSKKYFN